MTRVYLCPRDWCLWTYPAHYQDAPQRVARHIGGHERAETYDSEEWAQARARHLVRQHQQEGTTDA